MLPSVTCRLPCIFTSTVGFVSLKYSHAFYEWILQMTCLNFKVTQIHCYIRDGEQEMYTWQQIQEGRAVLGVPYNVRRISLRDCLPSCPTARLPVCLPALLPNCPPACVPACPPTCLPACLPACLPVCLHICLSVSVCLAVCLRSSLIA